MNIIPKVIHYFWFGNNPKPEIVTKCIASWKKYMPEMCIRDRGGPCGPQPISPLSDFQSRPFPLSADGHGATFSDVYKRQSHTSELRFWRFIPRYIQLHMNLNPIILIISCIRAVSYTHLDVYKRQENSRSPLW